MTEKSCMDCMHTYHSEICRECCVGDKFAPRPNAPKSNKERAELLNLRKRVEAQREEIRRLQAGGASPSPTAERSGPPRTSAPTEAITVGALWKATTQDIYIRRYGQTPLRLPSGGRLQLEHRALIVRKIEIVTRACEAPCFLVETEER